jgi:CheY-like chemotaxis protein/anti-sigma regulatory factor (Ser/Thr protein kinase)
VRPLADGKGVQLHSHREGPQGVHAQGDPARLQQVVWNLLTNSIKFTPAGGRIDVTLRVTEGSAEIEVRDTGQGIDPAFVGHVFERFRQADSSTTRSHGGLGLGLAIVKNLVELHGGRVRASSEGANRGATFTVTLPTIRATERPGHDDGTHPQDFRVADFSGRRIMVVDDQPDTRELVARVLAECGARVTALDSAAAAIAAISREVPDLLVTDIGMPEMDGFTLLARLRSSLGQRAKAMPAIALTAFARPEDRLKAQEVGFACHVSKPLEPAEFVSTVARVLEVT